MQRSNYSDRSTHFLLGRRWIETGTDQKRVNDEAIEALSTAANVYHRAGALVRVVRRREGARMVPKINPLPIASLRELLSEVADFQGARGTVHPPDWCVSGVAARGHWDKIRQLSHAVEYPVLRRDGTVMQVPGYDEETQLLYAPSGEFLPVPDQPTYEQVLQARDRLLDLVCDFPFAQPIHRAAWLAGLLTLFARHGYEGPSPLFLVDGNVRGAGKGLLCHVAALVATGRRMPVTTQVIDEAEERKRITAVARAGDPLMLIDNISRPFGNGAIDSALTSTVWKERLLGQSDVQEYPLATVWWGTGNNVQFKAGADTARRTLHMRLLSPEQNPEARTVFTHPNLVGYVLQRRPQLVADALTMLRGYQVQRLTQPLTLRPWGSFEDWSEVVRTTIVWAGLPDPIEAHEQLAQLADVTSTALKDLIDGWGELCRSKNVQACTVRQAVAWLAEDLEHVGKTGGSLFYTRLHDALGELCFTHGRPLPDVRQLGYTLRSYRGRVVDGSYLETDGKAEGGGQQWTVKQR